MAEDSTRPGAAEVRAAAAELTTALQAHLSAVERMVAEQDPAVQRAYDALRTALSRYDDLVFDAYGEVTPYRLAEPTQLDQGYEAVPVREGPPRLGVVARWEFVVEDAALLADRASEVWDPDAAGSPGDASDPLARAGRALGELVDAAGADAVAAQAHELGLTYAGSTLWVVESEASEEGETGGDGDREDWRDLAFDDVDPDLVIFRADVHSGGGYSG